MAYRGAKVWNGTGWDDVGDPRVADLLSRTITLENSRGAASGLATLDTNTRVPVAQLPAGINSGLATLDGSGKVPSGQIPFGTAAGTVTQGNDSRITGAEQLANKDAANGYPGLDSAGRIAGADMPLLLGVTTAISYGTAGTYTLTPASNHYDITLTANVTVNPSLSENHRRLYLHVLASGGARTFTLGTNVLESPGWPSSYVIPSGRVLTLELEMATLRGTSVWLLTRVLDGDGILDPMPRGLVARRQRTSNTAASSSTTAIGVTWVRTNVYAGRAYRVRSDGIALSSAAAQVMGFRFTYTTDGSTPGTGSTALETGYWHFAAASVSSSFFHTGLYLPASDQVFSVLLSFWRQSGSGNVTMQGNTTSPLGLIVEDMGLAPAVSGADI